MEDGLHFVICLFCVAFRIHTQEKRGAIPSDGREAQTAGRFGEKGYTIKLNNKT